ncbi:hypothetical protein RJ639_035185 [Escallonia herrerae]|uniref:Uncharacterized protein n=1 Tax=Escallonia herrerae TaxID=1293975 RepID=A0AA88WPN5_9ASTE|nr:hypothetical protein RJ639_035185 [Escallonia herrerae]
MSTVDVSRYVVSQTPITLLARSFKLMQINPLPLKSSYVVRTLRASQSQSQSYGESLSTSSIASLLKKRRPQNVGGDFFVGWFACLLVGHKRMQIQCASTFTNIFWRRVLVDLISLNCLLNVALKSIDNVVARSYFSLYVAGFLALVYVHNLIGYLANDHTCIDCDTCRWMAPEVFTQVDDMSAVYKQPSCSQERLKALQIASDGFCIEKLNHSNNQYGKFAWNLISKDRISGRFLMEEIDSEDPVDGGRDTYLSTMTIDTSVVPIEPALTSFDGATLEEEHGIRRQKSCPGTLQQNGVAEGKPRHLQEVRRSGLHAKSLPQELWPEAMQCACHVINRLPLKVIDMKSPFELLYEEKPSVAYSRVLAQCAMCIFQIS